MVSCDGIGTHVEGSFGGDPVEDYTKHNGKCNTNLTRQRFAELNTGYVDFEIKGITANQ